MNYVDISLYFDIIFFNIIFILIRNYNCLIYKDNKDKYNFPSKTFQVISFLHCIISFILFFIFVDISKDFTKLLHNSLCWIVK